MSTSGIGSTAVTTQLESLQNTAPKEVAVADLIPAPKNDKVDVSMKEVYKSLTVLAQNVLDKLQELIGDQIPGGITALKPEDHTSEKTAQRIVDGTTALFSVFAKQNSDLEGEELISKFMSTIRGGIETGYNEAAGILGDIGAFDIDGVKSGIDQTMKLVDEKLKAFEDNYRKQNGLAVQEEAAPVQ